MLGYRVNIQWVFVVCSEVVAGFGSGSVQVMESDKDFTYCLNKTTLENMTFYFSVQPASALEGQGK